MIFLFPLLLLSMPVAAGEPARAVVRVPQAAPQAPKSFAFGLPFEQGRIPGEPAFRAVTMDGSRLPLRCAKISQWPDGSAHWVFFEGRTAQEKLGLVMDPAAQATSSLLAASQSPQASAAATGLPLFQIESAESVLQGEMRVSTPAASFRASASPRDVFEENWGGAARALRIQGSLGDLRFDLRLSPRWGESRLDLEMLVHNPSRWPLEVEDLECVLSTGEKARAFWMEKDAILASLRNPKSTLRSTEADFYCWQGRAGVSFLAPGIRELSPKQVLLVPQGQIHLRLLAGKATIPAEGAVGWRVPLRFHSAQDCEEKSLARFAQSLRSLGTAQLVAKESRGIDPYFFPGDAPELAGFEELLDEGVRRLAEEMGSHRGWRDFGDHRLYERWSHLEYDTAAGLLWRGWRRGDESCLRLAAQALEHWKTQDRFFAPAGDARRQLPAMHGKDHAAGGSFESGHLWVEGLLRHFAMTGDASSREAALDLGDALLASRLWGREDGSGVERHWAWPLLVLAALQEFFPQRGYDRAMEEIAEEILLRFHKGSGFFLFDGRVQKEEGVGEAHFWLLGGLLLEALSRYQGAGGKQDVQPVMKALRDAILREGWDAKRQRFLRAAELDLANGATLDRWGSLKAVREIYLMAGLSLVRGSGQELWRSGRRRLRDLVEKFRWPKERVGNDLSLLLRAEPAFFAAFSES